MQPNKFRIVPRTPLDFVFCAMILDYVVFGMIMLILPSVFFNHDRSIFNESVSVEKRTMLYGLLAGSYAFCSFLGAPILGAWSDRVDRRRAVMFAYFSNFLSYILIALSITYNMVWLIFAGRILSGLCGSGLPVVQSTLADLSDSKSKARNFGLPAVAFGIGIIIGPLMAGVLSDHNLSHWFSYTTTFYVLLALSGLNVIFVSRKFPNTLKEPNHGRIVWHSGFRNFTRAMTDKKLANIFFVIFLLTCGFYFFIQFYLVYVKVKFDIDEKQLGLILGYSGVMLAIVQGLLLKPIAKRIDTPRILFFSIPLFGVAYLLMLIPQTYALSFLFLPIMALFQGLTYPNTLVIVSNLADEKIQGEMIGINQSVTSLAMAIPPVLAGFAMTFTLSFPMWFGAGCTFAAWGVFLWGWRNKL